MQGKIIKGIGGFYYVQGVDGSVYSCRARGSFRNQKIKPLVGDNVEIQILNEEEKEGNVEQILTRKNQLIRPAVANVDQALVVFAVKDPEPNLNLLDRFLIVMGQQHVPVRICFNKVDLAEASDCERLKNVYAATGYEVCFISTKTGEGIEELKEQLTGRTTVMAGPSGVGKSSLTNLLYPEAGMETGGISEKIRRGKHTTRHSEFFCLGDETYLLDTPGFSSIYLLDLQPEELKDYFPEFAPFEDDCRFLGCVHVGERNCGVKTALQEGKISEERYHNYRLLYEEQKDKRRYS